jgi:hypothetical protein
VLLEKNSLREPYGRRTMCYFAIIHRKSSSIFQVNEYIEQIESKKAAIAVFFDSTFIHYALFFVLFAL